MVNRAPELIVVQHFWRSVPLNAKTIIGRCEDQQAIAQSIRSSSVAMTRCSCSCLRCEAEPSAINFATSLVKWMSSGWSRGVGGSTQLAPGPCMRHFAPEKRFPRGVWIQKLERLGMIAQGSCDWVINRNHSTLRCRSGDTSDRSQVLHGKRPRVWWGNHRPKPRETFLVSSQPPRT